MTTIHVISNSLQSVLVSADIKYCPYVPRRSSLSVSSSNNSSSNSCPGASWTTNCTQVKKRRKESFRYGTVDVKGPRSSSELLIFLIRREACRKKCHKLRGTSHVFKQRGAFAFSFDFRKTRCSGIPGDCVAEQMQAMKNILDHTDYLCIFKSIQEVGQKK